MLLLKRCPNQRVFIAINDKVVVTINITEIRDGWVKLAFEADDGIDIDREELWLKKHPEEIWKETSTC